MNGEDDNAPFDGYMPYGKPYGFVRSAGMGSAELAWTVAHELGHGAFQLQHIWLEPGYQTGTKNLMGYSKTGELFRWQWADIHHPVPHSNVWADEEDLGAKRGECDLYYNYKCYKQRIRAYFSVNASWGPQIGVTIKAIFPVGAYAKYRNFKGEGKYFIQHDDIYGWNYGYESEGKDYYWDIGANGFFESIQKNKSKKPEQHEAFAEIIKKVRKGFTESTYKKNDKGKWVSDPTKDIFTVKVGTDLGLILFGFGVEVGVEGTYIEQK